MMGDFVAKHIVIEGRVQGVGFRVFVRDLANVFDIQGWVKNSSDGTVELIAHGKKDNFQAFIEQIEIGSSSSRVDLVQVKDDNSDTFTAGFRIIA